VRRPKSEAKTAVQPLTAGKDRKSRRPTKSGCVTPPAVPHEALPDLLFQRDHDEERAIRDYVEWQAPDEKVTHCEKVATETALGRKMDAWDVYTDKARWWVITSPTNLYRQDLFPSLDYTISFHVGVMARVMSQRKAGVPGMEQALMSRAWRRWEQAAEALDDADEAEEFQAVGMRCRESLVAMAKAVARPEMVPVGQDAPKGADVVHWCELVADRVAHGESAEAVRRYLKVTSKAGWQLVAWLIHAEGATRADAEFAITVTQDILAIFGAALLRHRYGLPDKCPKCGSYKVGLRQHPSLPEETSVPACHVCGWITEVVPRGNLRAAVSAAEAAQLAAQRQRTAMAAILASQPTKPRGEQ
jgi:hypothetical protein